MSQYDTTALCSPDQLVASGWKRLPNFRVGDAVLRQDGSFSIHGRPRACHGYLESREAQYRYDHAARTLEVQPYTARLPSATLAYRYGAWWLRLPTLPHSPYILDAVDKLGTRLVWKKRPAGPTKKNIRHIRVAGGSRRVESQLVSALPCIKVRSMSLTNSGEIVLGRTSFYHLDRIRDTANSEAVIRQSRRAIALFDRPYLSLLEYVSLETGRQRFFSYFNGIWYELSPQLPSRFDRGKLWLRRVLPTVFSFAAIVTCLLAAAWAMCLAGELISSFSHTDPFYHGRQTP